ncbi:MAG: hypothetical protein QOD03_288, partial [Verrucomicrobiota bacterium]
NPGISNLKQHGFGLIFTGSKRDDEFIHEREDGSNGFHERIAELLSVAEKRESTDFHNAREKPDARICPFMALSVQQKTMKPS